MQSELSALQEFAVASAERYQCFGDVIYPVTVQAEGVWFDIGGEVIGKLCKEGFWFFFRRIGRG